MKAGDCRRSTTAQHHRRSRSPLTTTDLIQLPDCPPEIEGRRSLPQVAGYAEIGGYAAYCGGGSRGLPCGELQVNGAAGDRRFTTKKHEEVQKKPGLNGKQYAGTAGGDSSRNVVGGGIDVLESVQWKIPVQTPNQAWNIKEQNEPVAMEYDSNDDIVDGSKKDPKCPIISVTKEEKERLRRPWRRSLIIKLLGRKVSYCYLLQKLKRMWNLDASFELIALDQDIFLAKFE
nr:uncharacterized protein LOC109173568 [Ipomoea batatas]